MASKKTTTKSAAKTPAKTPAARKKAAAPTPMLDAMEPVQDSGAVNKETVEAAMKAGTQAATKSYEQAVALAQEQLDKASSSVFQSYEDAATMGQENVDACVQSTTVFAKAVEAMSKEMMSFTQSAVDANVANAKALFGAKTMQELIDLQTNFSRSGFDSLVAESAKLTDLSMTLANDAVEPIQLRLNATVEKLMKPIAA